MEETVLPPANLRFGWQGWSEDKRQSLREQNRTRVLAALTYVTDFVHARVILIPHRVFLDTIRHDVLKELHQTIHSMRQRI